MKNLHICGWVLAALLSGQPVAAAPPAGWVVGWGLNPMGEATFSRQLLTNTIAPDIPIPIYGATSWSMGRVTISGQVLTNAIAVAAGDMHSLALTADGAVVGWGVNMGGEAVGFKGSFPLYASGEVRLDGQSLKDVIAVAAGQADVPGFSLALTRDAKVVAWGSDQFDQTSVPEGLSSVVAIAAGGLHGLAVKADGTVVSWGVGNPPPLGLTNVVDISAANEGGHDLALTRDGHVVDWAVRGARDASRVPAGLSNVVAVSAGWNHCLALKRDGTVLGWGFNGDRQATGVGGAFMEQTTGTVMVAGQTLTNVMAIAAAYDFSLALKRDGTVVAWGEVPAHKH